MEENPCPGADRPVPVAGCGLFARAFWLKVLLVTTAVVITLYLVSQPTTPGKQQP